MKYWRWEWPGNEATHTLYSNANWELELNFKVLHS